MVGAERTAAPIDSHRSNPGVRNPKFPTPIAIREYGSIGECEGEPRRLTILVGGNVADKGNSRAALRSVADSVHATLRSALGVRGGLGEAPRGKAHDPKRFAARLHFESEDSTLCFSFSVVSGENEASVYYARIAR